MDLSDEELNAAHFQKTLCTSRNYYVGRKTEYPNPRWTEKVQSIASINSNISSIRIRQPINAPAVLSKSKNKMNNNNNERKSRRRRLRKEHIKNRISPNLRWIVEDNDFCSFQDNEHEEKQRLLRIKLKNKRRKKRKERWKNQRNYLIKLALQQNQYTSIQLDGNKLNIYSTHEREKTTVNRKYMKLNDLWESHINSPKKYSKNLVAHDDAGVTSPVLNKFFQNSPILNVRTRAKAGTISYKTNQKKRKKYVILNKLKSKTSLDNQDLLVKRREKLRETYVAFKAMTAAVEKAHIVVKNDISGSNNNKLSKNKQQQNESLLQSLQKQQQRLTLEMQRMTRLLNESKLQVYGDDGRTT